MCSHQCLAVASWGVGASEIVSVDSLSVIRSVLSDGSWGAVVVHCTSACSISKLGNSSAESMPGTWIDIVCCCCDWSCDISIVFIRGKLDCLLFWFFSLLIIRFFFQ